jgi:hypothetical protein
VKVYGGWLRIPVTFTEIVVTKKTLVQDLLTESLDNFGMDGTLFNQVTESEYKQAYWFRHYLEQVQPH